MHRSQYVFVSTAGNFSYCMLQVWIGPHYIHSHMHYPNSQVCQEMHPKKIVVYIEFLYIDHSQDCEILPFGICLNKEAAMDPVQIHLRISSDHDLPSGFHDHIAIAGISLFSIGNSSTQSGAPIFHCHVSCSRSVAAMQFFKTSIHETNASGFTCLAEKSSELGNGKETCSLSLHHYQYITARFLLLLLLLPRVVVVVAVVVVSVWFRGLCHSYHNLRDHVFNNVQYHVYHCISHHMSSSSQFHCSTASVISYSIQYSFTMHRIQ